MKQTQSMKEALEEKAKQQSIQIKKYDDQEYVTPAGQEAVPLHTKVIHQTVIIHSTAKTEPEEKIAPQVVRFYLSGDVIFKAGDDKKNKQGRKLQHPITQMLHILIDADHKFVYTKNIKCNIDQINLETFKSQITRLKKWARRQGGLENVDIIEGRPGYGYRIPSSVSIQKTRS